MKKDLIDYLSAFVSKRRVDIFNTILQNRTRYIKIICEDIYQGHNASAILRTCDCFGIQDIHVIEKRNSFEVNSEVALGASNWLSLFRHSDSEEEVTSLFAELKSKDYRIVATTPHSKGVSLRDFNLTSGPVALMFGTEKEGLTSKLLDSADEFLSVDMYGFTESFNVSVSAGIILHHLRSTLMDSGICWKLSEEEQEDIKIDWLRQSIKRSDLIEKEFLKQRSGSTF